MGQSKPAVESGKPIVEKGKPTMISPTAKVPTAVRTKLAARGVPAAVVKLAQDAPDAKEGAEKIKEWAKGLPKRS